MAEEPNILYIVLSSGFYVVVLALLAYFLLKKLILEPFPGLVLNRKSTEELIEELGDIDDRPTIMNILMKRGESVLEPLLVALQRKPLPVKIGVVEMLQHLGNPVAVEPLIQVLSETQEKALQRPIIHALGQFADSRAGEPLLNIFEDIGSELQLETGLALTEIMAHTQNVDLLLRVLATEKTPFLENAIISAGKTGNPCFIEPLTHIWEHDDRRHIREKVVEVLGSFGTAALEPISAALKDSYWQVRAHAVSVLAGMNDERALELLLRIFQTEQRVPLRQHIAEILGETGDIRVIPTLLEAFDDEESEIRQTARRALQNVGVPAIEPLRDMLAEPGCHHASDITLIIEQIYGKIELVIFGESASEDYNEKTTLVNPEVFELTTPLSGSKKVEIHVHSYDFQQAERFVTYAVEYIGRERLKNQVDVFIYGNPKEMEPNLLNAMKKLCRSLKFCGGDVYLESRES